MERENKYLVIKNADIEKHLSDEQQLTLSSLITKIRVSRLQEGKVDQSYVVVAADWPMYEKVWGMIAAYVDGHPNEFEKLEAELAAEREKVKRMESALGFDWNVLEATQESLREHMQRLAECRTECEEQARLNGMGSEREAMLLAQLAECQALIEQMRERMEEAHDCSLDDDHRAARQILTGALALTSPTKALRQHDAALLRKVADETGTYEWQGEVYVLLEDLRQLADQIEKGGAQ